MNVSLTEDQINLIKHIVHQEGFSDYELETNQGSSKGDGSLGFITAVFVKSSNRKLSLILKSAETNETVRKATPIRKAYLREIYLYEKVLPEFEKFQKESGLINVFSGFARMYGTCDKENSECLIIENLKELDYTMWNRRIPMDPQHVSLVISEYAKFHAVSLAMNEKRPAEYQKLTENLGNVFENTYGVISVIKSIIKAFIPVKNNHRTTEALTGLFVKAEKFIEEDLDLPEDQLVITHADCWSNNMMFKYEDLEDDSKPTKVCLIDWQLSKVGSPVLDLAYFFFVCSPKDVLRDYKIYLKLYHDTVCENLRKLSCDIDKVFPSSLLQYHWKKYSKFGFYMAIIILKLTLSEVDEVADIAETIESGKNLIDRLNFESVHVNDYRQRILDIASVMAENDLI